MKIDIEEREGLMHVSVELPPIDRTARLDGNNREIWCNTSDVMAELEERGVEIQTLTCVHNAHSVHNVSEVSRKKTWVFSITEARPTTITKQTDDNAHTSTAKKRSTSRKTKK
tara:strand:- start:123 stop:461 length:339 start_codon:yes stop_codon:yes gene_type:complete